MVEKKEKKETEIKTKRERPVWTFKCHASLLKKLVSYLGDISCELPLKITREGVSSLVVDPAHVMLGMVDIPRKEFAIGEDAVHRRLEYGLNVDEYEFGVDTLKLTNRLKKFDGYGIVDGKVENNMMYLDCGNIHVKLSLVDTCGMVKAKIPELSLGIKTKAKISDLKKLCDGEDISDYLTLKIKDGNFTGMMEVDEDSVTVDLATNVKKDGRAVYSTDYFKNLLKDDGYSEVELMFDTDQPIQVKGEFGNNGHYVYILAPRIESE